jgi:hypothetical protein
MPAITKRKTETFSKRNSPAWNGNTEKGPWHKIQVQPCLLLKWRHSFLGAKLLMNPCDFFTNLEQTLSINVDEKQWWVTLATQEKFGSPFPSRSEKQNNGE